MNANSPAVENLEHLTQLTMVGLLDQLKVRRTELGLRQEDVAQRTGLSKITVTRTETEGANPTVHNFVRMALALNLQPTLVGVPEGHVLPQDIVHRGLAYNRVSAPLDGKDREREAALAAEWESANQWRQFGVQALMPALVPGHTQEQATAAATAIQWLGSQVGFDFLTATLDACGYDVVLKGDMRR
jgi:transcriptional regulator with XRE-family HTH domain